MRAAAVRARGGFTLIEVAVVLVLLGIGLAVALPALPRPRPAGEEATAALLELMAHGRAAAAREGGEVALTVDRATGGWRVALRRERTGADSVLARGAVPGWAEGAWRHAGPDSLWSARWDPLGRAAAPPLRGRGGGSIDVDPWTGRARVARP